MVSGCIGASRNSWYLGTRKGIGALGHWEAPRGVWVIWGIRGASGGVGGVRGVLGAHRDSRYSGTRRV